MKKIPGITKIGIFALCVLCIIFVVSFVGCGGGSAGDTSSSSPGTPSSSEECNSGLCLRWDPPTAYDDGSALSAESELAEYVVYVNTTGTFSAEDEAAVVPAVNADGSLATWFDLADLAGSLQPGVIYYVSMQSVSTSGVRSELSPSASFTL